jgi:hypothetical protein
VTATFHTRTPAPTWEDGLVTGSGRVGVVLHGPAPRQVLTLTHERFFVPVNPRPPAPDLRPVLGELRGAVLAGGAKHAGTLLTHGLRASGYPDGLVWTDPLGICATLTLAVSDAVDVVSRSTDLHRGEIAVDLGDATGGRCTVRVLTPRDGQAVWVALESDRAIVVDLVLSLGGALDTALDTGGADGSAAVDVTLTGGPDARLVAATTDATAVVTVRGADQWETGADSLTCRLAVPAGGRRTLRLDVDLGTGAETPSTASDPADWESLRGRQAATHGDLVSASVLDLRAPDAGTTTEEVWAAARAGDAEARRRVVEIAYLSGRANAIAATGELPPTLQGVWQGTWRPAWSADYTLNGNVQNGGMASLIPTGTPELARSLLTLVLAHLDDYRDNARLVFGAEGMLLPSRMSTHGRANHLDAAYPHVFWAGCGGWVLRLAADLVSTTGDRALVDDRLWSLVEGVLRFAETATVLLDGRRHLVPSYSPENTPSGADGPIATDATMDVAILRDAARAARVLAAARGDHGLDARWEDVVQDLPGYRVAADGTLAEWIDDAWVEEPAHRHASQLYPLWYEPDPAFTGPGGAALRAAALATVHAKIAWRAADPTAPPGRMEMAFGLVQVGLAAAALGDSAAALRCVEWLAVDHWRPALTTTHDAGAIFNLDASGGLPALVAAMLLGSTVDSLTVLPALPDAWAASGSVTGLRARGGLVVDRLAWDPDGCTLTLHRLPAAAWLAPSEGVLLAAGRPFVAPGTELHDGRLAVGEHPSTVRLEWAP